MSEYSFSKEIIEEYDGDEFSSKTLTYRIDGFMKACKMDLSDSKCFKLTNSQGFPYISKCLETLEKNYYINFTRNKDQDKGRNLVLMGKYNNLSFMFTNYIDKDKNKNKINNLPFHIAIGKKENDFKYQMEIVSGLDYRVKITLKKEGEKVSLPNAITFQVNIIDFSKVLCLVESFVDDPQMVISKYSEIINNKAFIITNKDLEKGITINKELEVPVKGFQKLIKFISRN